MNIVIAFLLFSTIIIYFNILPNHSYLALVISFIFFLSSFLAFLFSGISNSVSYGILCLLKENNSLPTTKIYYQYILKNSFNKRLDNMIYKKIIFIKDGYYFLSKKACFFAKTIQFIHSIYGINRHG